MNLGKEIKRFFKYKINHHRRWDGWISWSFENPFKTWWKARKYFKCPKITPFIHTVSKIHGYPYATWHWVGKIIDIDFHDVNWKDKWDSPRHERNPLIWICLFRKIAFGLRFNVYYPDEFGELENEDSHYWEYLLDYIYYSKSLKLNSWWQRTSKVFRIRKYGEAEDGSDDTFKDLILPIPTHLISLNKRGLKEFKKLYGNK